MGSPSGLILGVLLHSVPSGTAYAVPPWVPVLRTSCHALPPAHVADCLDPPGLRRSAGFGPYSVRATHCLRRAWPTAWTLRVCAVSSALAPAGFGPYSLARAPYEPRTASGVRGRLLGPYGSAPSVSPAVCLPCRGRVPAPVSHRQRLLPCLLALVRHVCSADAVCLLAFMARLRSRSLAPLCRFP